MAKVSKLHIYIILCYTGITLWHGEYFDSHFITGIVAVFYFYFYIVGKMQFFILCNFFCQKYKFTYLFSLLYFLSWQIQTTFFLCITFCSVPLSLIPLDVAIYFTFSQRLKNLENILATTSTTFTSIYCPPVIYSDWLVLHKHSFYWAYLYFAMVQIFTMWVNNAYAAHKYSHTK